MSVRTIVETVFPGAAGRASYSWRAKVGEEWRTSYMAADRGAAGAFETPEEARASLVAWLERRVVLGLPIPRAIEILRAQPEVWAVVHADTEEG